MCRVALIGLVASVLLGGCVRDPFVTEKGETRAGEWWIAHQVDRISGEELPTATVFAEASNSNVDYPRVSSLMLTCLDKKEPLVRFAFDFKIGSNPNTVLAYRFDHNPGRESVPIRVPRGDQIVAIEDRTAIAQFVGELATNPRKVYVRIRSLNGGRTAVEYPLDGAAEAMRAAFSKCDMISPPLADQGRAALLGVY